MEIRRLKSYTPKEFAELKLLMKELSERLDLTENALTQVLEDENSHLYVLLDKEQIIGCASLCLFHSPTGRKASIEDVVVLSAYRGRQLGRQLVEHLLEEARKLSPIELHLTSKPKRIAANALYQSLGFIRKETNFYYLNL